MKTNQSALVFAAIIGLATIGSNRVFAETEPNDSPETANPLVVPFTTNGTGVTVSGKLRAGNTTAILPDRDVFVFTNLHQFTSFQVKIQFTGIDGTEAAAWAISDATFTSLKAGTSNSTVNETVPAPTAGSAMFVAVLDSPLSRLTSASGEGNYTIEIIGVSGVDPIVDAVAAAKAEGVKAVEAAKAEGAKALADAIAAADAKTIATVKAAVDKAVAEAIAVVNAKASVDDGAARLARKLEIDKLKAAVTKATKAYKKAKTTSNKRKLDKATADLLNVALARLSAL